MSKENSWREKGDAGGPQAEGAAARVAAAMLAPLAESAGAEPSVVQMGLHALARWPALVGRRWYHFSPAQHGRRFIGEDLPWRKSTSALAE